MLLVNTTQLTNQISVLKIRVVIGVHSEMLENMN